MIVTMITINTKPASRAVTSARVRRPLDTIKLTMNII